MYVLYFENDPYYKDVYKIKVILDDTICIGDKLRIGKNTCTVKGIYRNRSSVQIAESGDEVIILLASSNAINIELQDNIVIVHRKKNSSRISCSLRKRVRTNFSEYNRINWERPDLMKEYRKKRFGNLKTCVCDYTGKTIHNDPNASRKKYGVSKAKYHNPSVEHKFSLKAIHEYCSNNHWAKFVPQEKLSKIANSDDNFGVVSTSINSQKRDKNGYDFVEQKGLSNTEVGNAIASKCDEAQKKIKKQIKREGIKAYRKEVAQNTGEDAVTIGIIEFIDEIKSVKNKEKTKKQAIKDGLKNFSENIGESLIENLIVSFFG